MDKTVRVTVLQPHPYGLKSYKPGDSYDMQAGDVEIMTLLGNVRRIDQPERWESVTPAAKRGRPKKQPF